MDQGTLKKGKGKGKEKEKITEEEEEKVHRTKQYSTRRE
jgi:hypothetical protein